jgi:small-conductance mechanosensitive channel
MPPMSWRELLARWDIQLLTVGKASIHVSTVLKLIVAVMLLLAFAGWLQRWLVRRLLTRTHLTAGSREVVGTLVRYVVIAVGLVVVMQNVGIDLSAFSVLAGALGVGIGFGLQNIFSNFISGLIVLFERPVKIGDRIEVAGVEGDVIAIGARATTLQTAQRARVIVPNQSFITGNVRNWVALGELTALQIKVRIAAEDSRQAESLLLEVAAQNIEVQKNPPPVVYLTAVDHQGCAFELNVWVAGDAERRWQITSLLHHAIRQALPERGMKLAPNP